MSPKIDKTQRTPTPPPTAKEARGKSKAAMKPQDSMQKSTHTSAGTSNASSSAAPALPAPNSKTLAKALSAACRAIEKQLGIPGAKVGFLSSDNLSDIKQTAALLAGAFLEREPMANALAARNPQIREVMGEFSLALTHEMAAGGLTPILKIPTGDVVSVVMAAPYAQTPPGSEAPPGLGPIFDVLHTLGNMHEAHMKKRAASAPPGWEPPQVLELAMTATHGDYQGRHITDIIGQLAILKAHYLGFTEIVAKATSNSQDSAAKLGFRTLGEVPYASHVYEGKKHFEGVAYPASAKLMWITSKDLQNAQKAISDGQKTKL